METDNYRIYTRFEIDSKGLVKNTVDSQIREQINKSAKESIERGKIEDIRNRPFLYGFRL